MIKGIELKVEANDADILNSINAAVERINKSRKLKKVELEIGTKPFSYNSANRAA